MARIAERILVLMIAIALIAPGLNKIGLFLIASANSDSYTGIVVKEGAGRYIGCKPFIEFYDNEGILREFKSEINYHYFFCPRKGDRIKLIRHGKQPSQTYTINFVHYIVIPIILILLGTSVVYSYFLKKGLKDTKNHNQLFQQTR